MNRIEIGLVIDTATEYGRGILRGCHAATIENNGTLWTRAPKLTLAGDTAEWSIDALICDSNLSPLPGRLRDVPVRVYLDEAPRRRGHPHIAIDDRAVGTMAAEHLLSNQLERFAAVGSGDKAFSDLRTQAFAKRIRSAGLLCFDDVSRFAARSVRSSTPAHEGKLARFLKNVPKPCGIFAACDIWAAEVLRHCRHLGIRVPEEIQVIGADNDELTCSVAFPSLSSVAIPWEKVGYEATQLAFRHIAGDRSISRVVVAPTGAVPRRSTDAVAVGDPDVAQALTAIRAKACQGATVGEIAATTAATRRHLERRFRQLLGRTMGQELRRARVLAAKHFILHTDLSMAQVALRSGFSSQTKLCDAFRKVLGISPRDIRKQVRLR